MNQLKDHQTVKQVLYMYQVGSLV